MKPARDRRKRVRKRRARFRGHAIQGLLPSSVLFITGVALDRAVENASRTPLVEFSLNLQPVDKSAITGEQAPPALHEIFVPITHRVLNHAFGLARAQQLYRNCRLQATCATAGRCGRARSLPGATTASGISSASPSIWSCLGARTLALERETLGLDSRTLSAGLSSEAA